MNQKYETGNPVVPDLKPTLLEKFLRYVSINTQSEPGSRDYPSTPAQLDFGRMLVKELKAAGLKDAAMDGYGYVTASLPPNTKAPAPAIGFLAHMDTSPDMEGKNVKPIIHKNYHGGDLSLNKEKGISLKVSEFPELAKYKGQTLITTDGTTLLGADDKAGIAEIITAMEFIAANPDFKHGPIKVAFTPDEEIGKGVDHFDVKKFGARYAYTLDGGEAGELEYENFNAAFAKVYIQGRNVHPGTAKNKMINSILLGTEFNDMLPVFDRPEHTEKYEGFFHLLRFDGTVDQSTLHYLVRDHDREKFAKRKNLLEEAAAFINRKYGDGTVRVEMKDQYYNMREKVLPVFQVVEVAAAAMKDLGIKPLIKPIRGGTDGSRLSYMGLPCPNLFAGGHNCHGRYEFIPLESMEMAAKTIIQIIALYHEQAVKASR